MNNDPASSQLGIDINAVYQWLDLNLIAYHSGYPNSYSYGVDICQHPLPKFSARYIKAGYDVKVIDNPTKRGAKRVLTLDPRIVRNVRDFVFSFCKTFGIPLRVPRGKKGLEETGPVWHGTFPKRVITSGDFEGILCHHHTSRGKWDIACWWSQIFYGTVLGD
jgi:hypothetical protein